MNVLGYLAVITNASMITFVGSKDAADRGKNIGECQDIPRDPLNGPCAKDLRPYGCWPAPGVAACWLSATTTSAAHEAADAVEPPKGNVPGADPPDHQGSA